MSGRLHIFSGSDNFSIKESVTKFIRKLCEKIPLRRMAESDDLVG